MAGLDRGRTILDDYSIRLQLEHLWNVDKCPALSREQRVERIRELGLAMTNVGLPTVVRPCNNAP